MTIHVNIHEAKTHLSRLIEQALAGEQVTICKAGKPLVQITPCQMSVLPSRQPGGWEGRVWMADDFDTLPEELLTAFYDGPIEPQ